jgi:hypothetical protein
MCYHEAFISQESTPTCKSCSINKYLAIEQTISQKKTHILPLNFEVTTSYRKIVHILIIPDAQAQNCFLISNRDIFTRLTFSNLLTMASLG